MTFFDPRSVIRGDRSRAAYLLWEQEQEIERAITAKSERIEELESQIVTAREKRADLQLTLAEVKVAREIIEASGLRVERQGTDVHVSVERTLGAKT